MKTSTGMLFTAAAVGAASVVVLLALRKQAASAELSEVPQIIDDCFQRIQQLERDLQKLRQAAEITG